MIVNLTFLKLNLHFRPLEWVRAGHKWAWVKLAAALYELGPLSAAPHREPTPKQEFIPHGTLKLRVLAGEIQLIGTTITINNPPTLLLAPPTHPLPIITATTTTNNNNNNNNNNSNNQTTGTLDPTKFNAILQLEDYHCGIQALDSLWSANTNKPSIWSSPNTNHTWSNSITTDMTPLRLPTSWSTSLSNIQLNNNNNSLYLIEGPKATGKSTFSTLLINTLLNSYQQVALLDLDPGQPILTPPTLISLHLLQSPILGPSFCSLVSPHQPSSHSIYIGHTTPKDCPSKYLDACSELINLYTNSQLSASLSTNYKRRRPAHRTPTNQAHHNSHKRSDQIPLVINTMGWTRGLGQNILNQLIQIIQPTHIFNFSDSPPVANIHSTPLEPIGTTPLSLRITPADSRILSILSYLYSTPSPSTHFFINQWDFQHPLWARRPFEVRPDQIMLPDHPDFDMHHLGHVLNGTLIAFVSRSQGSWIGFGLVRAIDPTRQTMHLLTPAYPTHEQNTADYQFVKYSEPELPIVCSLSDGQVPYLEKNTLRANSNGFSTLGSERKRIRRNVQRRSQISR
ncbi:hypothetical protein VP01_2481g3 [Puccinia sorghi]|uniref:Polynucleotide 5'-hydroxyl-kinase GRC3 n=1 Tax=Puccinia sorghi TaxID=27349 RepID=A0A0L6V620_9BASI|nr:hypothetical protein VP01_2481g3 [Puccinia sorghi]